MVKTRAIPAPPLRRSKRLAAKAHNVSKPYHMRREQHLKHTLSICLDSHNRKRVQHTIDDLPRSSPVRKERGPVECPRVSTQVVVKMRKSFPVCHSDALPQAAASTDEVCAVDLPHDTNAKTAQKAVDPDDHDRSTEPSDSPVAVNGEHQSPHEATHSGKKESTKVHKVLHFPTSPPHAHTTHTKPVASPESVASPKQTKEPQAFAKRPVSERRKMSHRYFEDSTCFLSEPLPSLPNRYKPSLFQRAFNVVYEATVKMAKALLPAPMQQSQTTHSITTSWSPKKSYRP